jgi:periplasmic divalent cation tolerance protein
MLLAKTVNSLFPAVMNRVKSLHSYEVPEIISFPIAEGFPDYVRWIEKATQ